MRSQKFFILTALFFMLCLCTQPEMSAHPASAPALRIYGVKIKVTDMDEALRFYCDVFGFETLSREHDPQLVALKDETLPLFLELTNQPCAIEFGKSAQAIISFQTNDLKQRMAELQAKGVRFVTEIGEVGVGISARFEDPFGNVHSLLEQTIVETQPFDEPRIYNVGFVHPEMAKAREFWCDKLGFIVRTERYYPPAIPLGHADGTFSHMLHERTGLQNAAAGYPNTSQVVILYKANEFDTVLKSLRLLGVDMLHEQPQECPLGAFVAIRDPFGVVSEIVQSGRN